jgi:hypothetical protein
MLIFGPRLEPFDREKQKPLLRCGPLSNRQKIMLAAIFYVAMYAALVSPEEVGFTTGYGPWTFDLKEGYALGGQYYGWFFKPLNLIDRQLRPGTWHKVYW